MKKIQLLSVVFSLIMFTGVTAGTAIAFAESDDNDKENWDMDDILDRYCEMSAEDKAAFLEKYPMASDHQEKMEEYCSLDESERDAYIEEHKDEFTKAHDYDIKAKLDKFCEMSPEELAALVEEHGKGEDHLAEMEEYCTLDDSGRDAFIEEHKDEFTKAHDYDIKAKLDKFCEMSEEDKEALQEKYPRASDHQEKIDEYCSLDESERDAFIEEHKDDYMKHDFDKRAMMDKFCEMSDEDRTAHLEEYQKSVDHLVTMEEYCSLDESERDAFIEEHKDSMKGEMSDHKDSMKGEMSDYKDSMKGEMSDHKDSMSSKDKPHMILRASTLTDEQKIEIKAIHEELRDFKHSLRDNSMSDSEKQEIRDQFMEKAKEFSMTWLSPRHQVAAGIDANKVECREGFALVMKTSNATPICVKEATAEKLIERGIVISSV